MKNLYIYKIVEEYFFNRKEKIPGVVLSLLKRVEPYLKDISDFLEELHLECTVVMPEGITCQFEFKHIINNYGVKFGLDCVAKEFWFSIEDINNNNYVFPEHDPRWLPINSIELLRKRFNSWVEQ